MVYDVLIIGGGAAGFFTAINTAERFPGASICILEKTSKVLSKVKVSGGGRCNFTHACFDPNELVNYYPRGKKELLGPFHKFACGDTLEWFESRGVEFYISDDGSIFPQTDDSETIIQLFLSLAAKYNIKIKNKQNLLKIVPGENWDVITESSSFKAKNLVVTTGSNKAVWDIVASIGHNIIKPVPSLFTFKIKDKRLEGLMGLVVENAGSRIKGSKINEQYGPLLITHWGLSGPCILKLSSHAARLLHESSYQKNCLIDFIPDYSDEYLAEIFNSNKSDHPKKHVSNSNIFQIPNRLWEKLTEAAGIKDSANWADISKKQIASLVMQLKEAEFKINGTTKFKEEFVTAGGVDLKEIDFKTFSSKLHSNLYFAGEVLDIDALTGGFNFQNAWTGSWIVSQSIKL